MKVYGRAATVTALEPVRALATNALATTKIPAPRRSLAGENCTVILTDMVGYGSNGRNDRDRRVIRAAHLEMLRASLGNLWQKCRWADLGDGLLIVVPPSVPTTMVMERLHRNLPGGLRRHNDAHDGPTRIQLRVAVTVGPVAHDTVGLAGEVLIRAARLRDSSVLREAMASTEASLGIIVSIFVYETVLRHAEEWANLGSYYEVDARAKEFRGPAWMQLI